MTEEPKFDGEWTEEQVIRLQCIRGYEVADCE
jgi:hypothetical protein